MRPSLEGVVGMEIRNLNAGRAHPLDARAVGGFGVYGELQDTASIDESYRDLLVRLEAYLYSSKAKLADTLRIMMPNRAFASCIAFMAGMGMSGHFVASTALFGSLMILSTYCSQAVFNNIRDVEGDRVNAPGRPLVSGSLSMGFAWSLMGALIVLGFAFAYLASPLLVLVDALYLLIGIVYSVVTKAKWQLAYATLATSHIVVPMVSGYLVWGQLDERILVIAGFMYLTQSLAWSIKDYKDVEGDRKTGVMTLPVVFSPKRASRITALVLVLPLLLFWVPWYMLHLSVWFLGVYLVSGIARCGLAAKLLADHSPTSASRILINFRYALMLEMIGWWLS